MPQIVLYRSGFWYTVPDKSSEQEKKAAARLKYWAYVQRLASLGHEESKAKLIEARQGKQLLHFSRQAKAEFISRGIKLGEQAENVLKFFVLTYPENWFCKGGPDLNRFLTNCRKSYGLKEYVWSCELQKNGQIHFHIIGDMPRQDIPKLSKAWERARRTPNKMNFGNGLTGFGPVKSNNKAVLYCAKYISKSENSFKTVKAQDRYKLFVQTGTKNKVFSTSRGLKGQTKSSFHSDIDIDFYENTKKLLVDNCIYSKNLKKPLHFTHDYGESGYIPIEIAARFKYYD